MRLLLITYRLPTDLCSGDHTTIHHLIKHLSARHQIVLLSLIPSDEMRDRLDLVAPYCERVELVRLPRWQSYLNCLRGLLTSNPLQVAYYRSDVLMERIQRLLQEEPFDVAYAYHLRSGQYLLNADRCPRVLDLKPVQTLNLKRMKQHVSNPVQRLLYRLEHRRVESYEPALVRQFERCFVISDVDRTHVDPAGDFDNIELNPHGVDADGFAPDPAVKKEPASVIVSGKMSYAPNVDAVLYFHDVIWPLIRAQIPAAKLFIVGAKPKRCITALARDPSVTVTGFVKDIRPYLNRAEVAIGPLRIAAGLQNKLLEGMAMGLPMVVTPAANEGIGASDGRDLLVAESPVSFAEGVIRLLREPEERQRMGSAARDFIVQNWTWEKYFDELEQMLLNVAQSDSPTVTSPLVQHAS
jgi:sugar transferase (PEP-CTERM/EpsH1 system associated)